MPDAMHEIETVSISILEKEYQVSCKPEEVKALKESAFYVDEKMREIKSSGGILGLDRIAVMAALNIANDYIGQTTKTKDVIKHQANKIQTLSTKLDQVLNRLKSRA